MADTVKDAAQAVVDKVTGAEPSAEKSTAGIEEGTAKLLLDEGTS